MRDHSCAAKRVLLVYYSQSGEVARIVESLTAELLAAKAAVILERLHPRGQYPYPWRSLRRFFDVMPETILGLPPPIEEPNFDPALTYDLVVIAYPVWFLSPAPPIQALFQTPASAVLEGADVVTISVSRSMWHNASETMKTLLAAAGARHRDNVVVTHQGSSLVTLISTPRALLFGSRGSLLGVFPIAGVGENDLARVRRLGDVLAARLPTASETRPRPLLEGEPAVVIKRWSVVPELVAWYCFRAWARIIRALGRIHKAVRTAAVYAFSVFLVCLILFGLPLTVLATWLLSPVVRSRLDSYVARLAQPTGLHDGPAVAVREAAASPGPKAGRERVD